MKVIVSVTTTKARLNLFFYSFQSLKKQTYRQFEIFVFISKEPYLFDDGIEIVPDWIAGENVKVFFVSNSGSYRKLLPAIDIATDDDIIITADDDVLYSDKWVQHIVQSAVLHPNCIICGRARVIKKNFLKKFQNYTNWSICDEMKISVDIFPVGCSGIAYRKYLLDLIFLKDTSYVKYAPTSDDIWFKIASLRRGIEICVNPELEAGNIYLQHKMGLEQVNFYKEDNRKNNIFEKISKKLMIYFFNYIGISLSKNDFAWKSALKYSKNKKDISNEKSN